MVLECWTVGVEVPRGEGGCKKVLRFGFLNKILQNKGGGVILHDALSKFSTLTPNLANQWLNFTYDYSTHVLTFSAT